MVPEIVSGRRCKIRCILCLFRPVNAAAAAKCNLAFLVLRVIFVRHLLAEQHPFESFDIHIFGDLIVTLCFLLDIFVQQCAPVYYEQSMRIVVRSRHTFKLPCRNQFAHQDITPALDSLPTIVGELHILFVKGDTVTEYREHRARTQYIGVKSLFLDL